ncbi:hypothetical protein ACH3XW_9770 [Acanthocheilonema viteae]
MMVESEHRSDSCERRCGFACFRRDDTEPDDVDDILLLVLLILSMMVMMMFPGYSTPNCSSDSDTITSNNAKVEYTKGKRLFVLVWKLKTRDEATFYKHFQTIMNGID